MSDSENMATTSIDTGDDYAVVENNDNNNNNNIVDIDRIAAVRGRMALARKEKEEKDENETNLSGDALINNFLEIEVLYTTIEEGFVRLEVLKEELKNGQYFAKTEDIFPRDKCKVVNRSTFKGAADMMTRKKAPCANDDGSGGLYEKEVNALIKHLPLLGRDGENTNTNTSVADMNSPAPSEASEASQRNGKIQDLVGNRTRSSQKNGDQDKQNGCIIPGSKGHQVHQAPNAPTCTPWWPLVFLWAIGLVDKLTGVYEAIEAENEPEKRQILESASKDALVQLATGTSNSSGMKSSGRNLLCLPELDAEYLDTGYNCIIVPIMPLDQIKDWDGKEYDVAIFVGEHSKEMVDSKNEKYNHFQDGPAKHTAVDAEGRLLRSIDEKDIKICSKDDLVIVADVLTRFLEALADLHTRSLNDDGTPRENVPSRQWGITDLADSVEKVMVNPENPADTKNVAFKDSKKGIKKVIDRLLGGGGGVRVPEAPDRNSFGGKHVFKATVRQAYPTDPMLVAAKGANNLGRQWGLRFLSGCPTESDSDFSSQSSDEGDSYATPPHSKDFTGVEIAVVIPDSELLPPDMEATTDDDGLLLWDGDAFSDVSTEEFDTTGDGCVD